MGTTATELWVETFHYEVTRPDGTVVMVDEDAVQKGFGLVFQKWPNGESSGYSKVPDDVLETIKAFNESPEKGLGHYVVNGLKAKRGTFVRKSEVDVDYS